MITPRFVLALILATATVARAADWPQFRGPGLSGVSDENALPDRWTATENVRWKADLAGRGVSSPVVVDDRVFVTACSEMNETRLHVLCFNADTGAKLWERSVWATGPTNCNPTTCMAAPTPTANRDHIIALFATGDLVCFDHAGNLLWLRTLQLDEPAMSNLVGRGASPVLHGDLLIVPMESQGASWMFGIDAATGRTRWKAERPLENNYTTPLLVRYGGRTDLVVQAASGLTGYEPATGTKRWEFADETLSAVASPAAADGLLLGAGRGAVALRLEGDRPPELAWRSARLAVGTPTPLIAGGRVYAVKDSGVLACADLQTGDQRWSLRLRGSFSASPVLAGGKLYLTNEDGEITVVRIGGKGEVVATNPLGDAFLATPAVSRGCLYLRSDKRLYCVGVGR
jgi:outer membrane protein assembly factor BamB